MPEIVITLSDITKLIELNKERAELEFKSKFDNSENIKHEAKLVSAHIAAITDKLIKAGMRIAFPHEKQISAFTTELKKFMDSEIFDALKSKKGEIYELLSARGVLLKQNFDNRLNIAKINILLSKLPVVVRTKLLDTLREGKLLQDISIDTDEKARVLMIRLFLRLGVPVFLDEGTLSAEPPIDKQFDVEVPVALGNKHVWVSERIANNLVELNNKIKLISTRIQLRNAEKQVKIFNETEEKEFADLQSEYLSLLKNQDAMLVDFYNEERELVVKFFSS
ncbi:hypothetical protein J4450_05820 [Candidatus Micrarchaeota archaeon]|nr:hypothetical protein [Candidatus Micrarchaeota archaeon]